MGSASDMRSILPTFVRLILATAPALALASTVSGARASQSDSASHVVVNVVNGLVYMSLGTKDGAAVGDRVEVIRPDGIVAGVLELDLCGEMLCRARLPAALAGKITPGLEVRGRVAAPSAPSAKPAAPIVAPPKPAPAPSSSPSPAPSAAPAPSIDTTLDDAQPVPTEQPTPAAKPKKPAKPKPLPPQTSPLPPNPVGTVTEAPVERPDRLPWTAGKPIPEGYVLVRRSDDTLVRAGWVMLGISYGVSVLCALADKEHGSVLLLPLAGPFVYAALPETRETIGSYSYTQRKEIGTGVALALGAGQVAGAAMLFFGYRGQQQLWRKDLALHVAPVLTPGFAGLAAFATF